MGGSKEARRKQKASDSVKTSQKPENKKNEKVSSKDESPMETLDPIKEDKAISDEKRHSPSTENSKTSSASLEKEALPSSEGEQPIPNQSKDSTLLGENETLSNSQAEGLSSDRQQSQNGSDEEAKTIELEREIPDKFESSNTSDDQPTDAFGEPISNKGNDLGKFFPRIVVQNSLVLPVNKLLSSLMTSSADDHTLQQRYFQYREEKLSEYIVHPVLNKTSFEKRTCKSCAEGYSGQEVNISKKLLEEDVPDYVLEMLLTNEDMEKEIKNKTNHLYQQHVLVNGYMAKLFGKSLGKTKAFCPKTGREELGKLYKLAKAYTLLVDVIHSMVTDNSLESWWQAFGIQQDDDEPSYEEIDLGEEPDYEEIPSRGPLSDILESDELSNASDKEILTNRKELDSMKIKLGKKIFEKKGILSKKLKSNFGVKFSARSEECPLTVI